MRCPICHREMHDHPKDWVDHHYMWPKRRFKKNHTLRLHRKCEKDYHAYWYQFCMDGCEPYRCRFTSICCYHNRGN